MQETETTKKRIQRRLLIQTSIGDIKPVFNKTLEIECRDKSMSVSLYGVFGLTHLRRREKINTFSIGQVITVQKLLIHSLMYEIRFVFTEEYDFKNHGNSIEKAPL